MRSSPERRPRHIRCRSESLRPLCITAIWSPKRARKRPTSCGVSAISGTNTIALLPSESARLAARKYTSVLPEAVTPSSKNCARSPASSFCSMAATAAACSRFSSGGTSGTTGALSSGSAIGSRFSSSTKPSSASRFSDAPRPGHALLQLRDGQITVRQRFQYLRGFAARHRRQTVAVGQD